MKTCASWLRHLPHRGVPVPGKVAHLHRWWYFLIGTCPSGLGTGWLDISSFFFLAFSLFRLGSGGITVAIFGFWLSLSLSRYLVGVGE